MRRFASVVSLLGILFAVCNCSAQQTNSSAVPNLIRYSGTLLPQGSAAVPPHIAGVTFEIYQQPEGGAPVWLETQNVTTDATGQYSVLLGNTTATGLPSDLFLQGDQRWLAVKVEGQPEQPRVLLVSVPYAFRAHEAETLGGRSVEDFVLAPRTNSPATGNQQPAAGTPSNPNGQGNKTGLQPPAINQGPTNFSGSTIDQIVGVTQSGTGAGVKSSAATEAILGTATAATGKGIAVHGTATGTGGVALKGFATANTGNTIGLSAYVASPAGIVAVLNNGAGGKIVSGQSNGVEKFAVDGNGNVNSTSGSYNIAGTRVLSIGSAADQNLFLGVGAGANNLAGQGIDNTFTGFQAGNANTSGLYNTFNGTYAGQSNSTGSGNTFSGTSAGRANTTGHDNTFTGLDAGYSNTTGGLNTFNGSFAGFSNTTGDGNSFSGFFAGRTNITGHDNTFSGVNAGFANKDGYQNTFIGSYAGYSNADGFSNTFSGYQAGYYNTYAPGNTFSGYQAGFHNTNGYNTFIGYSAGYSNTTGIGNLYVGWDAGYFNISGDHNIYIGSDCSSVCSESNVIRIGFSPGQTAAYIAGIYGATSSGGVPVYVNSGGQLGTLTSSRRFKEEIRDMGDRSSALMELRPVTFLYRPDYQTGTRTLQYGLIAEEVAEVYPDLVAYEADGQPHTVLYQHLAPMLLNELQKQYHRAQDEDVLNRQQGEQIEAQRREIETLKAELRLQNAAFQERLSRLESMVGTQTQIAAELPQK